MQHYIPFSHGLWNILPKTSHRKLLAMAEITSSDNRKQKSGFARSKKLTTRIDMTPMVDLGFLLITFFIFTSTMSQPTSMSLIMPKESGKPTPIKESGALTLLPMGNGKVFYYEGTMEKSNLKATSIKGIREVLINKKKRTPEMDLFVVIKPSKVTDYSTIIDILDEVKITNVKRYAIADITAHEEAWIK
jgi:biopolymer transport protein ExbD